MSDLEKRRRACPICRDGDSFGIGRDVAVFRAIAAAVGSVCVGLWLMGVGAEAAAGLAVVLTACMYSFYKLLYKLMP